jgi:hypothetical protein
MPESTSKVIGSLPSFTLLDIFHQEGYTIPLSVNSPKLHTLSTSPLGPDAMTGPSSTPKVSMRRLHCKADELQCNMARTAEALHSGIED